MLHVKCHYGHQTLWPSDITRCNSILAARVKKTVGPKNLKCQNIGKQLAKNNINLHIIKDNGPKTVQYALEVIVNVLWRDFLSWWSHKGDRLLKHVHATEVVWVSSEQQMNEQRELFK